MQKKIHLLITAFFMVGSCFAQNQWDNWIFGNKAYVRFTANSTILPTSPSSKTMPNWAEGVSSVSDANSNLLFYTNGVTVYSPTGTIVSNGSGLFGSGTSTESALIVPDPGNTNQYYVFTTEAFTANPRLSYTIVATSPSLSVPLATKNVHLSDSVSEKVAAIRVCGENAYWIVAHTLGNNHYIEYKLTASGISAPVIYPIGTAVSVTAIGNAGHLKFSSDGTLMCAAHSDIKKMELFNFNTSTGVISNIGGGVSTTYPGTHDYPYGVEFSPDSKKLYISILGFAPSDSSIIYQYDVSVPSNTLNTRAIIHSFKPTTDYGYCTLQLGPDNRIYTLKRYLDSIYYIPSPNLSGSACGYIAAASGATRIKLFKGTSAQMGLPSFPSKFTTCLTANAGVDDTICTGYAAQLSGSATGTGPFTYSWAPATGLSCTNCQNPIASPLTTTTYILTVTAGGSTATDAVTVTVNQNCCSAANNDLFTMITSNMTISSNTYFTGKYFVAPGVIITVSSALLDLTNVDIVFSPCSGIEFHNGATLHANNSVFRPCDINLWWLGFSFFDGSVGTVNSSTFENAGQALQFNSSSGLATYSNITNNLFLNCRKGVNIVGGTNFLQSITNNVFTVDFNNIDYSVPNCNGTITTPFEYHDIEVNASDLSTAYISQNQFINNQVGKGSTAIVSGIYYSSVSGGTISQNTFTNLYRDIDASLSTDFSIENNEMELLQFSSSQPYDYQIRLSQCSYVWVTGNHLINSLEYTGIATSSSAIYTENNGFMNVKNNIIDGCLNGILSFNDGYTIFSGNTINGVNSYGIYVSNLVVGTISCNEIHMQSHLSIPVFNVGIAYINCGANFNNILNNCIFDAGTSILLSSSGFGVAGPLAVANNYLYNYVSAGINNQGYSMNLGSGISTYGVSGHNTFTSNKGISAVYDVYSTTPLIAYGNFGIGTVNSNVTTVGNNVYSSTASCGQQIGPYANDQGIENICDFFILNLQDVLFQPETGPMVLAPGFEKTVNTNPSEFSLSDFTSLLQFLQASNPAEADKLIGLVEKNAWLTGSELGEFKFYHAFFAYDFATSAADLNALKGTIDENWFSVKSILVNHIKNDGSLNQISDEEFQTLKTIEQSSSPFAADARELLEATAGGYDYHFQSPLIFKGIEAGTGIAVSQAQLSIYPNPAYSEVTVQYVLPDGLNEATLTLYDLSGKLIETEQLEASSSTVKINLEKLIAGSYLVALENDGKILLRGKLIKE